MGCVSLLVWLILIPAIIFLVKNRPDELSLFPDGDITTIEESSVIEKEETGITLFQALKTPLFWVFAGCSALIFYPLFVSTQQLILYIRTPKINISPEIAS